MTLIYELQKLRVLAIDTTTYLASRSDRLQTLVHYTTAFDTAADAPHVKVAALAIVGLNTEVILTEMATRGLVEYTRTPKGLDSEHPKGWRRAG